MPEKDGDEMMLHLQNENAHVGDVFQKVEVKGFHVAPLFKFLMDKQPGFFGNDIKWNFTKFLIDKNGQPVKRFSPSTTPLNMTTNIDELLKQ